MRSTDLLGLYVRGLCSLLGARVVSVYVPTSPVGPDLAHDGPLAPVPELADLSQAARFLEDIEPEVWKLRDVRPGLSGIEVPSSAGDGRLIGIFSGLPSRVPDRRLAKQEAVEPGVPHGPELWLGLRLEEDVAAPLVRLPPRPDRPQALEAPWAWLLGFAGVLARHSRRVSQILDDPVTGLPSRAEFQVDLERAVEAAVDDERPLTLLMINPNDFNALNDRMSREDADQVVREIAERLRACHRRSDQVARYGSVVFTSILGGADRSEGLQRAKEMLERLHGREYFGGRVPLRFSLGVASFEPGDQEVRSALDLIRRADTALNLAKRNGGGIGTWQPGADEETGYHDRLTGIFTGRLAKDYRNMAVLSDTISVLAVASDPQSLAAEVVKGLYAAMKPERVGLFEWPAEEPQMRYGLVRASVSGPPASGLVIDDRERQLIVSARNRRRTMESQSGSGADETLGLAIPLLAGDDCLGVLYLSGRVGATSFDSSDLVFLEALATQVALALDRARLTEGQRRREEQERQRLLAEVAELRNALQRTQIIYRSRPMEALLDKVRRVAPTDATVLITGESGTGKELFARALHQLSPRRDQPFVVVDCGAIPTTLLESELFGHEKGAFTGAQARQLGRLVQADKGTLLLDEIGELPLEAQSRFLRFVQEKYVSPVGGRTGRTVDVRVIAATNRDLQDEVAAGRFRADFYHRLNVVRLDIPPLRERTDDVLHLAQHFCTMYALMYGRPVLSFSPEAEAAVLSHPWPGNVRELQNRVMRAMILAQGDALVPADLGFSDATASVAVPVPVTVVVPEPEESPAPASETWPSLREALAQQVEEAVEGRQPLAPLGRWLADDLVLEADRLGAGVASGAAALLGMPVTTFRRRLASSQAQAGAGWAPRPTSWPGVRARLAGVLRSTEPGSRNVLKEVLQVLDEEVAARAPGNPRVGAALLGVTLPTFRRRRGR